MSATAHTEHHVKYVSEYSSQAVKDAANGAPYVCETCLETFTDGAAGVAHQAANSECAACAAEESGLTDESLWRFASRDADNDVTGGVWR